MSGALAANGKTVQLAHQIWRENVNTNPAQHRPVQNPLGYYVATLAYAQAQVSEQAVKAVGSLDGTALSDCARNAVFETVVGKVKFGEDGGWAQPRVLTVQFQNIAGSNISEIKKNNTQAAVYPSEMASAALIYPYAKATR